MYCKLDLRNSYTRYDILSPNLERFSVGCLSALIVPFAKYSLAVKTPMDGGFDMVYFIGAVLPFILLGLVVGFYALFVEKDEKDMKRLFKICIGLPALAMTLGGGLEMNQAEAFEKQLYCKPTSKLVQGLIHTYDQLTSTKRPEYYVLSQEITSSEFILVDDKKYWIIDHLNNPKSKDETDIIFDVFTCNILDK